MSNAIESFRSDYLTDAQIEKGWPISRATIGRQRKAGAFPAPVRVGRLVLTRREDVIQYFTPKPRAVPRLATAGAEPEPTPASRPAEPAKPAPAPRAAKPRPAAPKAEG